MSRVLSVLAVLLSFTVAALAAEPVILAPNEGYCSRLGEVWVVVRSPSPPEVALDGRKVKEKVNSVGDIRHLFIEGVRPEGSELTITVEGRPRKMKVRGYESSGKPSPPFHTTSWGACSQCHEYRFDECRSCHKFKGHKHADYLKCADCHTSPGTVPTSAAPLCSNCHKEPSARTHRDLRHPLFAATDPKRPGKVFDCVSCHNPHTPKCLDGMAKAEQREWCRNCHSR